MTNASGYIDRPELRKSLLERIEGGSVLVHGARRIGKSTLLQQLVVSPPHGTRVVRIDLEGLLAEPIGDLAQALHKALRTAGLVGSESPLTRVSAVNVAGNGVELREAQTISGWAKVQQELQRALDACGTDRLVIALDEVPWWLDALTEQSGASAARAALATLRRIRQDGALAERLRMVLTGSIGLAGLAESLGASAELNDLTTLDVPPMTEDEGAALFESEVTGRGAPSTEVAARHAARVAGGSPHWIKVLAAGVGNDGSTADRVDAAVEALLAPSQRQLFADEGREHFHRRHPDQYPVLAAILEAASSADIVPLQAAVTGALASDPSLTPRRAEACVWLLVDGFYLRVEGAKLAWVNPLFRRWWLKYGGA